MERAGNDNERMLLRERARQFPPPYAIVEEMKTASVTSMGTRGRRRGPDGSAIGYTTGSGAEWSGCNRRKEGGDVGSDAYNYYGWSGWGRKSTYGCCR
eukprot:g77688.t1